MYWDYPAILEYYLFGNFIDKRNPRLDEICQGENTLRGVILGWSSPECVELRRNLGQSE